MLKSPASVLLGVQARFRTDALVLERPAALCVTLLLWSVVASEASTDRHPLVLALATLLAAVSVVPALQRVALVGGAIVQLARVVAEFPSTANHAYLQAFLLVVAAVLSFDARPAARAELVVSFRFALAIVLIVAGLQKAFYGDYFEGRLLAILLSKHERYRWLFASFIDAGELARLQTLDTHAAGSGPFRVDSVVFYALSNIAWIAEIVLGVLLMYRHRAAPVLTALFFVAIEASAREIVFGLVMLGLTSLYLVPAHASRALRVLLALTWLFVLVAMKWLPGAEHLLITELP